MLGGQQWRDGVYATFCASDSCLLLDYVRIINFLLLLIIIISGQNSVLPSLLAASNKAFSGLGLGLVRFNVPLDT